jgi:integrase
LLNPLKPRGKLDVLDVVRVLDCEFGEIEGRPSWRSAHCASIALARGVHPKVVQEALGHATIAVTLDLYSHVVPSLQREAAKEMGVALFG